MKNLPHGQYEMSPFLCFRHGKILGYPSCASCYHTYASITKQYNVVPANGL